MTQRDESYSWTQPICDGCWDEANPERPSPRHGGGADEMCVWCGLGTNSGIYIRTDPATAPYPSILR